jgi:hypothetical protein
MLFFYKKIQNYLVMSKICSTFAPAFEKLDFLSPSWGPRKFLIFGESENTAKIHMSNFIANRIKP